MVLPEPAGWGLDKAFRVAQQNLIVLPTSMKEYIQQWMGLRRLDDGWPESAEEHVNLLWLEGVHKRCVWSWRCIDHDSGDEQ